jgi:DNA-dependent RNA polymerase auxiliary subunit epsilon
MKEWQIAYYQEYKTRPVVRITLIHSLYIDRERLARTLLKKPELERELEYLSIKKRAYIAFESENTTWSSTGPDFSPTGMIEDSKYFFSPAKNISI